MGASSILILSVMAIDVGEISTKLISDLYPNQQIVSERYTAEWSDSHATYVANAFFDELGDDYKVVYEVCGQDRRLSTATLIKCFSEAKRKGTVAVIIPFNGSNPVITSEFWALNSYIQAGGAVFFSAGNFKEHNPSVNYPHAWCFSLPNCFLVSYPKLVFKGTKVADGFSCLPLGCQQGSSHAVARYAAQWIKRRFTK